jgi:hypothetical protein
MHTAQAFGLSCFCIELKGRYRLNGWDVISLLFLKTPSISFKMLQKTGRDDIPLAKVMPYL